MNIRLEWQLRVSLKMMAFMRTLNSESAAIFHLRFNDLTVLFHVVFGDPLSNYVQIRFWPLILLYEEIKDSCKPHRLIVVVCRYMMIYNLELTVHVLSQRPPTSRGKASIAPGKSCDILGCESRPHQKGTHAA